MDESKLVGRLINAQPLRIDARRGQAHRLGISEHEIHGLDCLARRAFDQVVDGGDGHDPSGSRIGVHGNVTVVGASHVAGIGHGIFKQSDESLAFVEILIESVQLDDVERPSGARIGRTQDASIHRN